MGEPLVVGFSGGSDSLALLQYLLKIGGQRQVHALHVNHKIKPDADEQANKAKELALALGARAKVLLWNGNKLKGHANARDARYQMLAAECKRLGSSHLWIAHTRDDQVETFFLRIAAGSGVRGLAVMGFDAPFPIWPEGAGLRVLRPLLAHSREYLRNELKKQNLCWLEDEANQDRNYARVRLRQQLRKLQDSGFAVERTLSTISHFQQIAAIEQEQVKALMHSVVEFSPFGFVTVKTARLSAVSSQVLARFFEKLMLSVSGGLRCKHTAGRLVKMWKALHEGSGPVTLNGCLLKYNDGVLWVFRDPGSVRRYSVRPAPNTTHLQAGSAMIFDQRWKIVLPVEGRVMALADNKEPLDADQRRLLGKVPFYARASMPGVLTSAGEFLLLPMKFPEHISFQGAVRGMETGIRFA